MLLEIGVRGCVHRSKCMYVFMSIRIMFCQPKKYEVVPNFTSVSCFEKKNPLRSIDNYL
jgi:hypothetical protein